MMNLRIEFSHDEIINRVCRGDLPCARRLFALRCISILWIVLLCRDESPLWDGHLQNKKDAVSGILLG